MFCSNLTLASWFEVLFLLCTATQKAEQKEEAKCLPQLEKKRQKPNNSASSEACFYLARTKVKGKFNVVC
jgi:hypothetical protein